jgi:hypothetical protein
MSAPCTWPDGVCHCWAAEQEKPDSHGRVWMHCEEGLAMTKASMARFMLFCLSQRVEIGSINAFNPNHPRSTVLAAIRIRPDQIALFEAETGGRLRPPPTIALNSQGNRT